MADIFISYKREDQEELGRVAPIAEALRAEGYDVFYDVYVPPGSSWEAVLQEKMDQARCVIVLWSAASVTSDWVKEEAEMAKADGKLIPVFLDAVSPPFGFARIEGANLADWNGDLQHQEWKNLVAAVKARIGQGEGAAAPGLTRVDYAPSKQVEVTKSAPGRGGGGGVGKWLAGIAVVLVLATAGFFGWQAWQANEMARDRASDAAIDEAMTRGLDQRAWAAASEANTVAAYERYLAERPAGAYRGEALDRIAALRADLAARADTDAEDTPVEREAPAREQALRREERIWLEVRNMATIAGFERYLGEYPSGRYADEARMEIRRLQAAAARARADRPADLAINIFDPRPDSVVPGEEFIVDLYVSNQGGQLAPGSGAGGYMVDFVLGRDATAPVRLADFSETWSEDVLLRGGRSSNTSPIEPAGASFTYPRMSVPEGWPEGRFQLCAVVDPGRKVEEVTEANNVACRELVVGRPPGAAQTDPAFDYSALQARRYKVGPVTITNLRLDPAPPAQMREGEDLTIRFDYRFDPGQEAQIWMRPVLTGTPGPCSYGASGSPSLSGRGSGQQSFSLSGGGCGGFRLREVVIKVGDRSGTVDKTFPVAYLFR